MQPSIQALLSKIYGSQTAESMAKELASLLEGYRGRISDPRRLGLSQHDAILITYADQVQNPGQAPLESLGEFCEARLAGLMSGIHILPFYPWSSDDGFSVIDYESVAPQYGSWEDVRRLAEHFRLMFDAVIDHASAESAWFKGFLRDEPPYRDFFIEVSGEPDLSSVVRPRALPLLTAFPGKVGSRQLWTTFSADQVDLNYHNPAVLLKIIDVMLFYASQGAEFIRLDAIAYLWKEPGTSCINLPQTHSIVQLMRAILDEIAPHVMLITETNVPNLENLSYFGDGTNEAQVVYNFPLPPLVLHALQTGSARTLARWAANLQLPTGQVTFLNFLASHDGIGLNPVRGILPESEIQALAERAQGAGGFISMKTNPNGTESPYEININYLDALNASEPGAGLDEQVRRFVAAHAILLAFVGVPAIYFHSLLGSRGWPEGVMETRRYRTVNREKLRRADLERELAEPDSRRSRIFTGLARLLRARAASTCFSPDTPQQVLQTEDSVFALLRGKPEDGRAVVCVHSVSGREERVMLDLSSSNLELSGGFHDLITGRKVDGGDVLSLSLSPFEVLWLEN